MEWASRGRKDRNRGEGTVRRAQSGQGGGGSGGGGESQQVVK